MAPGSMPPDAVHIAQEGLRIPPVVLSDAVAAVLVAASRTPDERRGDLDAQVGANRLGVTRLAELVGAPFDEIVDYGERRMRAALRALPDGRWRAEDVLDSTGPRPEQQRPAHRGRGRRRRRRGDVRLRGYRRAAAGNGERGRGGDRQRGGVRAADRDRPDDPRQRRRAATGPRARAAGLDRRRAVPGRGRARATSRSASASRTSACARWPRSRPTASVPRARAR